MSLVEHIKWYIKHHKLTKKEFAKQAGIDYFTLRRFEKGEGVMLVNFQKIVKAVGYEMVLIPKKNAA